MELLKQPKGFKQVKNTRKNVIKQAETAIGLALRGGALINELLDERDMRSEFTDKTLNSVPDGENKNRLTEEWVDIKKNPVQV